MGSEHFRILNNVCRTPNAINLPFEDSLYQKFWGSFSIRFTTVFEF